MFQPGQLCLNPKPLMDNSSREKNHFQIVVVREILGPIVCILFSSKILKEKKFLATFFNVIKIKMLYMTIFQLHDIVSCLR